MVCRSRILLGGVLFFITSTAVARIEEPLDYTKAQSFSTALRFLRVDSGYKVIEQDLESGYMLFEYPVRNSSSVTSGSIEVVDRGESVALVVQLPQMPRYHERHLADGLLRKLKADYGEAPKREPAKPVEAPEEKPPEPKEDDDLPPGQSRPGS
jgi:hypothetical protein